MVIGNAKICGCQNASLVGGRCLMVLGGKLDKISTSLYSPIGIEMKNKTFGYRAFVNSVITEKSLHIW